MEIIKWMDFLGHEGPLLTVLEGHVVAELNNYRLSFQMVIYLMGCVKK